MVETKSCRDNHAQIIYTDDVCPLCLERERMDELLDAKTDIDQQNIFDLDKRVTKLEKLMKQLMPDAYKSRTRQIISRVLGAKKQDEVQVEFDA